MSAEEPALASEDWLKFLAEAGTVLAGSLQFEQTLAAVARLCVPRLADWCVVDLFDRAGRPSRVAVEHADPGQVEKAWELQNRYPPDPQAPHGAAHVARTGRSELYPSIPDDLLVKVARDEDHLRLLREIGIVSAMVVPLLAGGRSLGAITFICTKPGCRYGRTDLEMAEELARRAGLAIENARLYEEAREAIAERERLVRELEAERAQLNAVLQQLPSGVIIADAASGRISMTNDQVAPLLTSEDRPISSIDEFDRRKGFHPDGRPFTPDEWPLRRVIRSGETVTDEEADCLCSDGSLVSVSINAAPVRDREGRVVAAVAIYHDVTERKKNARALAEQREWFRVTLASIGDAVIVTDSDGRITFTNPVAARLTGWSLEAATGQPLDTVFDIVNESTGEKVQNPVGRVLRTGAVVGLANHTVLRSRNGGTHPIDDSAAPIRSSDGSIRGVVLVFRDVTQRRRADAALREEVGVSETLNRIGGILAAELDLEKLVQRVTDEATSLTGARFGAFFYKVTGDPGESLTLYTISGVPREHFDKFPMPRNTAIFSPTFHGQGVVRLDDVTQDPRYGRNPPYSGMPKGHLPVKSYLAVPVISRSGEVLGGLFFGHPDPAIFDERDERLVVGIAAQAAVAIDNARLYEQAQRAAANLQRQLEFTEAITRSLGEGVYTIDREGRLTYMNPAAEAILGWKEEELRGQSMHQAIHFRDARGAGVASAEACRLMSVVETGQTLRSDSDTFVHRDGRSIPVSYISSPTVREGIVDGAVVAFYDITERKEAEQALRRAEEQYRSLVMATSQIVWGTDASGEIDDMPQWRELTGQSREEVRGYGWLEAIHPDDRERARSAWLRAFESQTHYQTEYRLRMRNGSYRWFLVRGIPVLAGDGSVREWVGTCTDIDDRRWAEEQLRLANQELASARDLALEASRAKSAFLANMSHELRTPLNAIIGYSEMLEEEAMNCETEAMGTDLRKIQTAGRHLLTLINDVLDLSKIEAGKMELYVARFPIAPLVDLAVETVHPMAEKHGNSLIVEVPPDIGTMRADETKLRQILFNLLSNACKFTEQGTVSLEVSREAGNEQEWILFRVSDTGLGMDSRELISLFREFTQLDPSSTRKYGGTGLGLAISRRFARMMGGDITVRSEKGEGSVFTLRIPAAVEGKSSGAETEETVSTEELIRSAAASGPPHNVVLVIDDDPTVHDLIRRTLEREGFAVASAYNGKAGVEMARRLHPRAITLDVMMPQVDGWTVLSELKADPALADIPVIVISIVDDRNLGFALGATDYMTKPIERERLLAVLRRFECDLRGCRVLLVEADSKAREMMARILEGADSHIIPAASGQEALQLLEEAPLDLILLDLIMPEMDGFEFLEAVRRVPKWRAIPIVALTAKELSEHDRQRLTGAVERILQKGGDLRDDLLREVCDVIVTLGIGGSE